MDIELRTATPDDAQRCGTICYEAFKAIADQHGFPPDVPSAEVTIGLLSKLIADPRFYAIVAEIDHQVVGSNFMDERSAIAGIGPITIDPTVQNRGIAGEYVSVARLKIDPVWDPIRNDPGFQKLLSEPEPETVYR